jgi:hypothetical protein
VVGDSRICSRLNAAQRGSLASVELISPPGLALQTSPAIEMASRRSLFLCSYRITCTRPIPFQWRSIPARRFSAAVGRVVSSETIPAPHKGVVRVLKFNRPAAKNAISLQLLSELRQEIEEIKNEGDKLETRVLVIGSSVAGVFCAGADLKERKGMSEEQ